MHRSKTLNITIYILLGIFTFIWLHINTLPLWIGIFTLIPPFLSEFFSDIRHSKLMAYAYTHRRRFAAFVLGICFFLAVGLYIRYPLYWPPINWRKILHFQITYRKLFFCFQHEPLVERRDLITDPIHVYKSCLFAMVS